MNEELISEVIDLLQCTILRLKLPQFLQIPIHSHQDTFPSNRNTFCHSKSRFIPSAPFPFLAKTPFCPLPFLPPSRPTIQSSARKERITGGTTSHLTLTLPITRPRHRPALLLHLIETPHHLLKQLLIALLLLLNHQLSLRVRVIPSFLARQLEFLTLREFFSSDDGSGELSTSFGEEVRGCRDRGVDAFVEVES